MYIDSDYGLSKKYSEYKTADGLWKTAEFVLKFNICQNDKACQTDFGNAPVSPCDSENSKSKSCDAGREFFFPGDDDLLRDENCKCKSAADAKTATKTDLSFENDCPAHGPRPDSMVGEIIWKHESKQCDKCNSNAASWGNSGAVKDGFDGWRKRSVDNIWNGEVCLSCLGVNKDYRPPNQQQTQLREDISHDGEQLLSDLSSMQKCYMEELPSSEVSYDRCICLQLSFSSSFVSSCASNLVNLSHL